MRITGSNGLRRGLLGGVAFTLLLAVASCRKKTPPAAPVAPAGSVPGIVTSQQPFGGEAWLAQKQAAARNISAGAGQSFAHVTYKPSVKTLDESAVRSALVGISSDGHGVVFNNAPPEILALKADDIFMVKGQFAVKVLGARTTGSQTVLIVNQAKLSDVVQQGTIHLDTPVSFHGPSLASAEAPAPIPAAHGSRFLDLLAPPVYAQNGTGTPEQPGEHLTQPGFNTPKPGIDGGNAVDQAKAFAKALTSGWTVERWAVTPTQNSAVISARMSKDAAGFLAVVTLDGTVSNFQFTQDLTFPVNTAQVAQGHQGDDRADEVWLGDRQEHSRRMGNRGQDKASRWRHDSLGGDARRPSTDAGCERRAPDSPRAHGRQRILQGCVHDRLHGQRR